MEMLPGHTLLEAALTANVPLFHDCGGQARCTTCRVRVIGGTPPARTASEMEVVHMQSWRDDVRLACQLEPTSDLHVERIMRQEVSREKAPEDAGFRSAERSLAVLFCDIAGFTEFAATRMPYDVVHVLNRVFLCTGEAVLANSGHIDKYLGDGLLALWGIDGGEPAELVVSAVRAALLMQHAVVELSTRLHLHFEAELSLRVGIHFGPAIIGRVGHPALQQLTAIGDSVNIAARVEAQNKELRTSLLITEECYAHVRDLVTVGDDFRTVLRGQSRPQRLYEITGLAYSDPIFLVQRQMHVLLLDGQLFVERFFENLLSAAPEMRALFHGCDMPRQYEQFLTQLTRCVRELRHLPEMLPVLRALGARHGGYGVGHEHFVIAGIALRGALAETLGEAFDQEADAAWTQVFETITGAMEEGIPV